METYTNAIPSEFVNFVITLLLTLLLGLSQRKHFKDKDPNWILGTDRTYSIIGILGFVLYTIDSARLTAYIAGLACLMVLVGIYYYNKISSGHGVGIVSLLITLLCYSLGPLICLEDLWISIMVVVSVLLLNEMKESFIAFTKKVNDQEYINLAKFLVIAGVILPILPNEEIVKGIPLTPYNIWLTTVVISGFSYISYLLKRYVFNKSGIIVSGLLGGIYSSTATCVILAKKAKDAPETERGEYVTAIFGAISTMYIKYLILLSVFNQTLLKNYWYAFAIMFLCSALVMGYFYFKNKKEQRNQKVENTLATAEEDNPLEIKIALVFAALFVVFTILTNFTIKEFGTSGLRTLSIFVGVTDITPFILNLFQAKYAVAEMILIIASFQAIVSNNIVKMIYAIILSQKTIMKQLLLGFGFICIVNIVLLAFIS